MPPKPSQRPGKQQSAEAKKALKTITDDKKVRGPLQTLYYSAYQSIKMLVIIADAIVVGWEAECLSRYNTCPEIHLNFFALFDNAVSIFLIVGLVLQIKVEGKNMLNDFIGIFEAIIVVVFSIFGSFLYRYILSSFMYSEGLSNFLVVGRICRMIVLIKATEDLRAFPYLNDLYLLVRGLRDSLQTLLSSVIILGLVVFTTAVILTGYIGSNDASDWSAASRELKTNSFSSVWGSMQVLFRFVFVDDAADIIEPLSRERILLWYMFMLFILVSVFLVMNLIMAIIVNQAMVFTKNDKEHKAKLLQKEKEHYTRKVIRFFNKIDLDGNAKLTFSEFEKAFDHPEIRNDLLAVGVEVNELRELFFILDTSNTGELAVADFVTGMQRIRGQATSRDLLMISQYTRRVFKLLMTIKTKCTPGKAGGGGSGAVTLQSKIDKLEHEVENTQSLVKEMARMLGDNPSDDKRALPSKFKQNEKSIVRKVEGYSTRARPTKRTAAR